MKKPNYFYLMIILSFLVVLTSCRSVASPAPAQKLVLIGLDSATWEVIDPLQAKGELPTLQSLRETGSSGTMESLEDLISPVVWTSIASGKLPGKHGIYDFNVDRYAVRVKRLWEILTPKGLSVGLFRYLVTWPYYDEYLFSVPCWMAQDSKAKPDDLGFLLQIHQQAMMNVFTGVPVDLTRYDQSVETGLLTAEELADFKATLQQLNDSDLIGAAHMKLGLELDTRAFIRLYKETQPDVAFFGHYGIDFLSHKHYHGIVAQEPLDEDTQKHKDILLEHYRLADKAIGRILEILPQDCTVIVFSDHGARSDIAYEGKTRQTFLHPEPILTCLGLSGLRYVNLGNYIYFSPEQFTPTSGSNLPTAQDFIDMLKSVHTKTADSPLLFVGVTRNGTIYCRVLAEDPSGIGWIYCGDQTIPASEILKPSILTGSHAREAIIILKGPQCQVNTKLSGAKVCDIAPTALHLLGLPVGKDMDGVVLEAALQPDYLRNHPVNQIDTYDDKDWIADRQKARDVDLEIEEKLKKSLTTLGYPGIEPKVDLSHGSFVGSLVEGKQTLAGSVEGRSHGEAQIAWQGTLDETIAVPEGLWDITFISSTMTDPLARQLSLTFPSVPVSNGRTTSIIHDLNSKQIKIVPSVTCKGLTFGDNMNLYVFEPGETRHKFAVRFIRSGQLGSVGEGVYDLEFSFANCVPHMIRETVPNVALVPGTTYRYGYDMKTTLIRVYVTAESAAAVANGSVQYYPIQPPELQAEVPLDEPIMVALGSYRLIISWQDTAGAHWQLERTLTLDSGQPGDLKKFTFNPEDPNRQQGF